MGFDEDFFRLEFEHRVALTALNAWLRFCQGRDLAAPREDD